MPPGDRVRGIRPVTDARRKRGAWSMMESNLRGMPRRIHP